MPLRRQKPRELATAALTAAFQTKVTKRATQGQVPLDTQGTSKRTLEYGLANYTSSSFNVRKDGSNNGGNLKEDWPAAYGAVELFWKPTSSWTVKAFHGGYAAGIRCSGGQCRNVPAFTGTRLAVVGTFQ